MRNLVLIPCVLALAACGAESNHGQREGPATPKAESSDPTVKELEAARTTINNLIDAQIARARTNAAESKLAVKDQPNPQATPEPERPDREARLQAIETALTLQILTATIEGYRRDIGNRYPPMSIEELDRLKRYRGIVTEGNHTNESAEVLLVALRHPDLRSPIGGDLTLANTDDDNWNLKPDGMPDVLATEVVDSWGTPIVYFHKDGYDKKQRIVNHRGETVDVSAIRKPDSSYYNPVGFQLISLGPNGRQDTPTDEDYDDAVNFKVK